MKKVIMGSMMFLAGIVSCAVLLGMSMAQDWTLNNEHSALWNLSQYGLTPVLILFVFIAIFGLVLAFCGVFEKRK